MFSDGNKSCTEEHAYGSCSVYYLFVLLSICFFFYLSSVCWLCSDQKQCAEEYAFVCAVLLSIQLSFLSFIGLSIGWLCSPCKTVMKSKLKRVAVSINYRFVFLLLFYRFIYSLS